ncbi:MAG: PQQ-binding-like beta-propeller repeat protein [Gemmataceae bacterium]
MRFTALSFRRCLLLGLAGIASAALLMIAYFKEGKPPPANETPQVVWSFEQAESGAIISTPVATEECVYVAAIRDSAFRPSGIVYCLDRRSGKARWKFDDDGGMKHTYSTPCLWDGRLYVGEGMHGNDVCKMYCLDAASGRKLWEFVTGGHIESSPCVAEGAVYFGSGDDGLYCLDAGSGAKRWQFQGQWHVDVSPAVADGRLYAGSGVSRLHRATEIFCLDVADGRVIWRRPTQLPVWGSPLVKDGQVFFGTGTGRLTVPVEPPEKHAGALVCADAASGRIDWIERVDDGIFARPAVDAERVYFGARDGRCYCLDRRDGRRLWQTDLGSPIVTRPALVEGRIHVAASGGLLSCLDAGDGRAVWTFDITEHTQTRPRLLSSPVVLAEESANGRHHFLYLGTELRGGSRSAAMLYCLRY